MFAVLAASSGAIALPPGTDLWHTKEPSGNCVPWPGASCQPFSEAQADSLLYLTDNMFPFDKPNAQTLLDDGLAVPTAQLSLMARQRFGWAARVPRTVWKEAVLPYAVVNEARTNWRQLLWDNLSPLLATVSNSSSLAEVFYIINNKIWTALGGFSVIFAVKPKLSAAFLVSSFAKVGWNPTTGRGPTHRASPSAPSRHLSYSTQ